MQCEGGKVATVSVVFVDLDGQVFVARPQDRLRVVCSQRRECGTPRTRAEHGNTNLHGSTLEGPALKGRPGPCSAAVRLCEMMQPPRPSPRAVVLLPIKSFSEAKHRLSPVLDTNERAALARELATRVFRAALDLPVAIVCDDDDVAAWGHEIGASVLWRPGVGLNGAVTA